MKKILLLLAAAASLAGALAQEPTPTPVPRRNGVWQADLPGGKYTVRLNAITAVSMHEYLVDGAARVTEVNIDTIGTGLVRFYFIEPNTPQTPNGIGQSAVDLIKDRAQEALSRGGGDDAWSKVVKSYPTTTHARTVEYRLATKESLNKLFDSIRRAFLNRQAGTFKP